MIQARLFQKLSHSSVRCTACSWYCTIKHQQTGICHTRYNHKGILYSLVYGKPVGIAIDPIEKKPLYHLHPGANVLSFGTVGCNFGCTFCQNDWMSQCNKNPPKNQKSLSYLKSIIHRFSTSYTPKKLVELALDLHVDGIAYTYNEPSIFVEYAYDVAKRAKKHNLLNIFVSNGYESQETCTLLIPYLDGINIDLKSFTQNFYTSICKANIQPVLENINKFFTAGVVTEVTTLLIPKKNDSDREIKKIAKYLVSISPDIPWHINAFRPAYQMNDVPPTPNTTLIRAYTIGKQAGLRHIYLGNISDSTYASSSCPNCSTILIKRERYNVKNIHMDMKRGICSHCHSPIYGTWI